MNELKIRELQLGDIKNISHLHCVAFPSSVLSRLGEDIVNRYYSCLFQDSKNFYASGCFEGENLAGFLFGGTAIAPINVFIKKNKLRLLAAVLLHPNLVFDNFCFHRIWKGLKMGLQFRRKNSRKKERQPVFHVRAIAVDPGQQRKGIGRLLMQYAEQYADEHEIGRMNLSVNPSNLRAINFYKGLDWRIMPLAHLNQANEELKMEKFLKGRSDPDSRQLGIGPDAALKGVTGPA
jgi:ribosomal protein S18 acetylase RimI-like enzyme